jgi:ribosome maturation factor RimP
MVSLDDYKRALGSLAELMTEEEIKNRMELQAKLARAIFDMWGKSFKTKSTNAIK